MVLLIAALNYWPKAHGNNARPLGWAHLARARLITVGTVLCHIEIPPSIHIIPHAIS